VGLNPQSPIRLHILRSARYIVIIKPNPQTKYRSLSSLLLSNPPLPQPPFLLFAFFFSVTFYNSLRSLPFLLLPNFFTPISAPPPPFTFRSCHHHPFSPFLPKHFSLPHTLHFSLTGTCHPGIRFFFLEYKLNGQLEGRICPRKRFIFEGAEGILIRFSTD